MNNNLMMIGGVVLVLIIVVLPDNLTKRRVKKIEKNFIEYVEKNNCKLIEVEKAYKTYSLAYQCPKFIYKSMVTEKLAKQIIGEK